MIDKAYLDTVRLLLDAAPEVFAGKTFALKGGTAINLFVRDMPRLSVDLDLVYTNHELNREAALLEIGNELQAARQRLDSLGITTEPVRTKVGDEVKLLVTRGKAQVKVEVNVVYRGTLLPIKARTLAPHPRDLFMNNLSLPVLAEPELYGSKLVAALDRQHPRDLFDVCGLFKAGGISTAIMDCFLGYLIGHNRPIHEVLFSRDRDLSLPFENEFAGMSRELVTLAELVEARTRLRQDILSVLTEDQRQFLIGFVKMEPVWSILPFEHLQHMPAIRWKMQNLAKLKKSNPEKYKLQSDELNTKFER